jgi:aldose 1-epimerase
MSIFYEVRIQMKLLSAILLCMTPVALAQTSVTKADFGKLPSGENAEIFTLKGSDITMRLTTFGARVVSIDTKDKNGKMGGVLLGHDTIDGYVKDTKTYFGSVPGRYANRIAKGIFTLEGKTYHLPINNPPNSLHGGTEGFERHNWSAKKIPNGVEFTLISGDGDQGYPGALTAHVRYTLEGNTVRIQYSATTNAPTIVNLTNHAYFNLGGDGSPSILNEQLTINADRYTPIDSTSIPLGPLEPVAGTPFDFRTPHTIGSRINDKNTQLKNGAGYDHNFVLNQGNGTMHEAATVHDPDTGRILVVKTTEPGVQFYSGNFLDGTLASRTSGKYAYRSGLCLETQHFPDSPNEPSYPSTELKPGQTYHSETTWTFSAER